MVMVMVVAVWMVVVAMWMVVVVAVLMGVAVEMVVMMEAVKISLMTMVFEFVLHAFGWLRFAT